jgi:hypothetical protein
MKFRKPLIREIVSDLVLLVGAASVTWGVWQWSPPAAHVVAGLAVIGLGYLIGRGSS